MSMHSIEWSFRMFVRHHFQNNYSNSNNGNFDFSKSHNLYTQFMARLNVSGHTFLHCAFISMGCYMHVSIFPCYPCYCYIIQHIPESILLYDH